MFKKELPLVVPPILLYVDFSYTLSIIRNYKRTDAWFFSNYIQLFYQKRKEAVDVIRFFITDINGRIWNPRLPWFHYQIFQRNFLRNTKIDIIDLLINSINENNYICLYWDQFYVPNSPRHLKEHYCHETLIYGYDLTEKCLYYVGFNNYENYGYYKVLFSDFRKAYYNDAVDLSDKYLVTEVCLLKFNNDFSFEFDINTVAEQLNDYFLSRNSLIYYRTHFNVNCKDYDYFNGTISSEFIFGMNIYKYLQSYIESLLLYSNLNFQPVHALWEHKKIMVNRIEYLQKNSYLSTDSNYNILYKQIQDKALLIRNLFFKYNITKKNNIITKMVSLLNDIFEQEKTVLSSVIQELREYQILDQELK
jgi:hypothetical protein